MGEKWAERSPGVGHCWGQSQRSTKVFVRNSKKKKKKKKKEVFSLSLIILLSCGSVSHLIQRSERALGEDQREREREEEEEEKFHFRAKEKDQQRRGGLSLIHI